MQQPLHSVTIDTAVSLHIDIAVVSRGLGSGPKELTPGNWGHCQSLTYSPVCPTLIAPPKAQDSVNLTLLPSVLTCLLWELLGQMLLPTLTLALQGGRDLDTAAPGLWSWGSRWEQSWSLATHAEWHAKPLSS